MGIKERIANLLSIKSLVTVVLTFVFAYLAIIQKIQPEQFNNVFLIIISFYFGTQAVKE